MSRWSEARITTIPRSVSGIAVTGRLGAPIPPAPPGPVMTIGGGSWPPGCAIGWPPGIGAGWPPGMGNPAGGWPPGCGMAGTWAAASWNGLGTGRRFAGRVTGAFGSTPDAVYHGSGSVSGS
jgi:hypothetical protein